MSRRRTVPALITACIAGLALVPAAGASTAPSTARRMQMTVVVQKFVADKSGVSALGTADATVGGRSTRRQVTLAVSRSTKCTVLSLRLQNLRLQLLGLDLVASPINLHITGNSSGTLGALFCRLASGLKLSSLSASRAAVRTLNRHLASHPMHVIAVRSRIAPASATTRQTSTTSTPAGSCDVLDLVLGPLNLDLLGLVVDLYGPTTTTPVEVHVSANPNGGILGSVFCKLANGQAVSSTPAA